MWQVAGFAIPASVDGPLDGALDGGLGEVVAADLAAARVGALAARGEDVLPRPALRGAGILDADGVGKVDVAAAARELGVVPGADGPQVRREVGLERGGKHRDAVLLALAVADEDLVAGEVEVLDAQAQRFHEPEARAVEQGRDEARLAAEAGEDAADLVAREDDGEARGRRARTSAVISGKGFSRTCR